MWSAIQSVLKQIDDFVWGVPLMVLILSGGLLLTVRLGLLQVRKLGLALKWMVQNEEEGEGEISSFAALCTALSATIGTGNIVGVATELLPNTGIPLPFISTGLSSLISLFGGMGFVLNVSLQRVRQ